MTLSVPAPVTGPTAEPTPHRSGRSWEPLDLLAAVAVIGTLFMATGPLSDDNDVFWHILIGRELLDGTPFSDLGSTFSFTVANGDWRTGAWLSEVLMAWLHDLGGWPLLVVGFRLLPVLGVATVLWFGVLRRYPSRASVGPFVLAMLMMATAVEERPQSWSFVFVALAAVWWLRTVADAAPPRWWLVIPVAALWANLHGLWVLLPVVMALAALGRMLDHGPTDPAGRRAALASLAAVAGGCLTPLGPSGLLLPFHLSAAGRAVIVEWQPVAPIGGYGWPLAVVAGCVLVLLGRTRPVRWADLVLALPVIGFGLLAARNVAPAVLLLTPLFADLAHSVLGGRGRTTVSTREASRLRIAGIAVLVAGVLASVCLVAARPPGPDDDLPTRLAEQLADQPAPVRLLNDYNLSGIALFYGGPDVQVAVDGRADYYGADYLTRYIDATVRGRDLTAFLRDIEPTHVLIGRDSALAERLLTEHWRVVGAEDGYLLLARPGS